MSLPEEYFEADDPQRIFLEFELEEEDCYRILFLSLYIDSPSEIFIGEVLIEAKLDKELVTDDFYME